MEKTTLKNISVKKHTFKRKLKAWQTRFHNRQQHLGGNTQARRVGTHLHPLRLQLQGQALPSMRNACKLDGWSLGKERSNSTAKHEGVSTLSRLSTRKSTSTANSSW